MKTRGSLLISVFFLLAGIFFLVQSLFFRYWESMVLPLFISCCVVVLGGTQVIRENKRDRLNVVADKEAFLHHTDVNINSKLFGLTVVWTAIFIIGILIIGFYLAIPIFTFIYLKWRRRSWVAAIAFTSITLGIIYLVFIILFKVSLFQGLIFGGRF